MDRYTEADYREIARQVNERDPDDKDGKVILTWISDERLEISLNGQIVASANHDEHGWSGMAAVRDMAGEVARVLGVPFKVAGEPNL